MNKSLFIFFLSMLVTNFVIAQNRVSEEQLKSDTIFVLGGKQLLVNISEVLPESVSYTLQVESKTLSMENKKIQRIVFNSGDIKVYNRPVFELFKEKNDWRTILITEDEEEVKDFYKIDEIEARSSGNVGNKKKVKKNVIVMLQKQAAELGGNVILLTKSEALGAYGEMPGYNIKGIVYSLEPPAGNKVKRR